MKIITTAAIKGGTGKTTTAAAIAQAAAEDGKKVLCIDMDPQGNLTEFTGAQMDHSGAYELLSGSDAKECIQSTEQGIDVIAGRSDLQNIKTTPGSASRLSDAIKPLKRHYDLIIIDSPPQMSELTFNALMAANGLIIPLEADRSSLQGLYQIIDIADQIREHNKKLKIIGCILTRYDSRSKINRYIHDAIADAGAENGAPLIAEIRPGIAIREAQAMQQSIYKYASKCNPAKDYQLLYKNYIMEA